MQSQTRIFIPITDSAQREDSSYLSDLYEQEPVWPIFICLFGTFQVLKKGYPVAVHSAKVETLLRTFALQPEHHEHRTERNALLQIMWPGYDIQLARQSLNTLVHNLRMLLGEAIADASPIFYKGGYYRLNVEAGIGVDTRCFDELVALGDRQDRAGNEAASIETYGRAVRLYRGNLCSDIDPHFLGANTILERERLRDLYLMVLVRLANYFQDNHNYRACIGSTQRILVTDPYREDAHRTLMRCYTLLGQRSQALHQYRLCEQIVRLEFNTTPERATGALYEQIRLDAENVDPTYQEMRLN